MSFHVDSTPGAYAATRVRLHTIRSLVLIGAFALAGTLPLLLSLAFDVPFRLTAPVVLILAVFYWAAESETALMERWLKGRNGELAVGGALEELRWERYIVLHDIPAAGEGNIDHIVWGPNGVFLIETKFRSYLPVHLTKAKRQSARLHDELEVWVTPVICLATREREPYRHEGVWVMGLDALVPWIREQSNTPAEFDRLARFAELL
ncbi:MAG: nuclease-related domain-containing protein [Actinomycetota bacterium]